MRPTPLLRTICLFFCLFPCRIAGPARSSPDFGITHSSGCAAAAADSAPAAPVPEPVQVRLLLPWAPQAQFAGYYLALKEGEYAKRGLEVEIIHSQPSDQLSALIYNRVAEFVVCPPDSAIGIRRFGAPVRLVSQIIQRSNLALVAWKDANIASPGDFDQRRISLWIDIYRPSFNAFFKKFAIKPAILPQGYSQALFLNRAVAACAAMEYNETHALLMQGIKPENLSVYRFFDYGIDLVEDGLYVTEEFAKSRPDLCRAMAEATLAGWKQADDRFKDALDAVMWWVNASHIPTSRVHQEYMLKTILPTIWPKGHRDWQPGRLDRDDYQRIAAAIADLENEDYFIPIPHLTGEADTPENDGSHPPEENAETAEPAAVDRTLPSYEDFTMETAR